MPHVRLRAVAAMFGLAVPLLIAFGRLAVEPTALLVDLDRPCIDERTPPDALVPGNDLTRIHLPRHLRIARQVASRGWPSAWDDAGFGGRPRIGDPQVGLWYPPVWLIWWLWAPSALGWLTLAHLWCGGIGCLLLARKHGVTEWPAFVAGVCFELNPYLIAQTFEGHLPHVWAASWYPWAFLAFTAWLRGSRFGLWALPPAFALSLLTGHAQEGYYLILALSAWVLCAGLKRLMSWSGVMVVTASFIAIEALPASLVEPWVLHGPHHESATSSLYHVHFRQLVQLISPSALGGPFDYRGPGNYWDGLLSAGFVPLVLAALGLFHSKRRNEAWAWLAFVLGSVVFALGRSGGLFALAYEFLPAMDRFRVPSRALFLAALGAAMLAGLGLETLAFGIQIETNHRRRTFGFLVGVLAICELTSSAFGLIRVTPASRVFAEHPANAVLERLGASFTDRVRARDAWYSDLSAITAGRLKTNLGESFQLRASAGLYQSLYAMFGTSVPGAESNARSERRQQAVLDRMSVAWLVTDVPDRAGRWPLAASANHDGAWFGVYRNPSALPRAYVVPRAVISLEDVDAVDQLSAFDPRQVVLMKRDPLESWRGPRQPFTPVVYDARDPDAIEIRVTTQAPGLLVVADAWLPGWSAEVNGDQVPVQRANWAQCAVALTSAGEHVVVLRYRPPGLAAGAVITLTVGTLWLLGFLFGIPARSASARVR